MLNMSPTTNVRFNSFINTSSQTLSGSNTMLNLIMIVRSVYLDFLKVECRVDDSSVFRPFLTIILSESLGYHVTQRERMWLLEIINFVEHFLHLLRIHYSDGWCSSKPCKKRPSYFRNTQ